MSFYNEEKRCCGIGFVDDNKFFVNCIGGCKCILEWIWVVVLDLF